MPYGTVSNETRSLLADRPELLAECEDLDGPFRVDVIVSGALDESFNVASLEATEEIMDIICMSLIEHPDLISGEEWEVSVYDEDSCSSELVAAVRGERVAIIGEVRS